MLGLPDGITACLFDLDGVLTKTAEVHARAWKETFDRFLGAARRAALRPRARLRRVRRRQAAPGRRARLPGLARDRAARGLGRRPAGRRDGQRPGQRQERARPALIRERRRRGLRGLRALPAGRARGRPAPGGRVLEPQLPRRARGGRDRGPARGPRRRRRRRGAPPARQAGARHLPRGGAHPRRRARRTRRSSRTRSPACRPGHAGGFGYVVGVDRAGQRDALLAHGAEVVVDDLAELL